MTREIRFAVASDLHIGLPQTIQQVPHRFHLVEVSIPAFEQVLDHLTQLDLDFLLLPGDLTQDGEPENHRWLQAKLATLPFPVYVVPGNHDVPTLEPSECTIGFADFPGYYAHCGYRDEEKHHYTTELLPGIRLIALNSNQFDADGKQFGVLDPEQLNWLEQVLQEYQDQFLLVMVHHNLIEHLPEQSRHELGKRYMLDNHQVVLSLLREANVKFIFTGHLHVQDIAQADGIYEITTGSLVSYPHPYRVINLQIKPSGQGQLKVKTHRVNQVPGWEDLPQQSRQWTGDRSTPFMTKLLTSAPVNMQPQEAVELVPQLRYFWADICAGDAQIDFPNFPPHARKFFQRFSTVDDFGQPTLIDNDAMLRW